MTTKFIGMKEFRENMTKYSDAARKGKIRYIVLRKNTPILEVTPINEEDFAYINLKKDFARAEKEVKSGKFYTLDQAKKLLGIGK